MRDLLEQLLAGKPMTPEQTAEIFAEILGGKLHDAQIAAVLAAWRVRGETSQELFAGAAALRAQALRVSVPAATRPLADNCGTGGDGAGSFNVSTAAAIVASAAGVRVAKHGNRGVSSKCGSADLLFAAGFPASLAPEAAGTLLERTGFTFFFAPSYHPVLASVASVRKALGVRTLFNLLGPLANPLAPEFQLIGVGALAYVRPMAETLAKLGVRKALVVHSRDGLDEVSPAAPTDGFVVDGGAVRELTIDPSALGVRGTIAGLAGGDATVNLRILERILAGEAHGAADAVALNAGVLLWLAGAASTVADGLALARQTLGSGKARDHFAGWLAAAQALAAGSSPGSSL
jgi:anthranilate phosphoribosyltransferase